MSESQSYYVIGDVHGCYKSLKKLVAQLPSDAHLMFLGDLINRGHGSLDCVKFAMDKGDKCTALMGNHEMHFLAVTAGARKLSKKDTFKDILDSRDLPEIIEWTRNLPLALFKDGNLFVHAGVHPTWTREDTLRYAGEVRQMLLSPEWKEQIGPVFGNSPAWKPELTGFDRLRAIVNVLLRSRFIYYDGSLEFKNSDGPETATPGLYPWFDHPERKSKDTRIICGHWSTCGLTIRRDLITLDTGCCWNQELTALRLPKIRVWQTEGTRELPVLDSFLKLAGGIRI